MNSRQWSCICGFTHQLKNVQLHFLEEHKIVLDESVSCGICRIKFNDPDLLKQHSVIHIQRCLYHIQSDSDNTLTSQSIVTCGSGKDCSSSPEHCSIRSVSNSLDNNNEQQQLKNCNQILPFNSIEICEVNSALTSPTNVQSPRNSTTLLQINNQSPTFRNSNKITKTLHPQFIDQVPNQYVNLLLRNQISDPTPKTSDIKNYETNTVAQKSQKYITQLFNGGDDEKRYIPFKSINALNKILQPNKLVHFYKCMEIECSFTSNDGSSFLVHLARHNLILYKCVYCFSDYSSAVLLISHMTEKHGSRQYQCGLCLYRASQKLHVIVHHQVLHKNDNLNVLPCVISQAIKTNEKELDVNYSAYAKAYRCAVGMCHFETFDPEEFKTHNNRHHKTICMYPCSYCEATCLSVDKLIQHYQLHNINNYQCTYCLHGTNTKLQLLIHLSIMHADLPINVYVRSSDEPTPDIQNSFTSSNDYSTSLTKSTNSKVTASFNVDIVDVIEPRNETIQSNSSIKENRFCEQDVTCITLDKYSGNSINFGNAITENWNRHMKNSEECLRLSKTENRNKKVTELTKNHKINSIKQKDRHIVLNKSLCISNVSPDVEIYDCCICSESLLSFHAAKCHLKITHCIHHLIMCSYCPKSGLDEKALRHHIITKHINKDVVIKSFICRRMYEKPELKPHKYRCSFCTFGAEEKQTMVDHLCEELNYNTYSCGICRTLFLTELNIVNHFASDHPDECIIFTRDRNHYIETWIEKALQNFQTSQIFSNHNSLYCPLCNRNFANTRKLCWHLYQHKQYKQYWCHHCNKQFFKLSHFNRHKIAVAKESSETINVMKVKVPLIERWAKEIIQNITIYSRKTKKYVENNISAGQSFSSKISNTNTFYNQRWSSYTNLDIHLAGIYKCYYCCFCANYKYAIERHCKTMHFGKHTRFFTAGQISRIKKMIGSRLHLLKCWQCKEKMPRHIMKKHRLKCKWKPYEKHSCDKKRKLNNCCSQRKYSNFNNIHQNHFGSTRTSSDIRQLQLQGSCFEDQIFSCYCCQQIFCSLKLFHRHWQSCHACNKGPFMFQLPIRKSEHLSKTYAYQCSYCNKKSLVFNVIKDHVIRSHPSRIFKIKITHEEIKNASIGSESTVDYTSKQKIGENGLCDNENLKIINKNITVNTKVEGLSSNLKLPVTYLAEICNILPLVMVRDVLSS